MNKKTTGFAMLTDTCLVIYMLTNSYYVKMWELYLIFMSVYLSYSLIFNQEKS